MIDSDFLPSRSQQTLQTTPSRCSYMMSRIWKYGLLFRVFGCLFIEGFHDRSLTKARVKFFSPYVLCTTTWLSISVLFGYAFLGSRAFLNSGSVRAFTKSLLFIIATIVIVKNLANTFCVAFGTSKFLHFLRDAAAYEQSTSYVAPVDADCRKRKLFCAMRRFAAFITQSACFGLAVYTYLNYLVEDYGEKWRPLIAVWAVTAVLTFLVYDTFMHTILSRTSDVLADYLHHQVVALSNVFLEIEGGQRCCEAARRTQEIRINVSRIRGLIRSIDSIWHTAVVTLAACLTFLLCITIYAVLSDGLTHPQVKIVIAYSVFFLLYFFDLAAVSQALVDEARKLKNATKQIRIAEEESSCFELQVQYLHDTIDPEAMSLRGGNFFALNKALLVTMAGSIITNTVVLAQTGDRLEDRIDVSKLA